SRRRERGGRPCRPQRKKGRARAADNGGGVRPRAPPGGEETPRGSPRGGRRPWLSGPTRGTSDSGGDKAAAYTHATSRRNCRTKAVLGHQEFPVADDRLAIRFDGRRTDRAFEPERGLVGAADELVPSDSDRDGAPHDRVLKETEGGLRVRSDGERGDAIPISRRHFVLLSQGERRGVPVELRQAAAAEFPSHASDGTSRPGLGDVEDDHAFGAGFLRKKGHAAGGDRGFEHAGRDIFVIDDSVVDHGLAPLYGEGQVGPPRRGHVDLVRRPEDPGESVAGRSERSEEHT